MGKLNFICMTYFTHRTTKQDFGKLFLTLKDSVYRTIRTPVPYKWIFTVTKEPLFLNVLRRPVIFGLCSNVVQTIVSAGKMCGTALILGSGLCTVKYYVYVFCTVTRIGPTIHASHSSSNN